MLRIRLKSKQLLIGSLVFLLANCESKTSSKSANKTNGDSQTSANLDTVKAIASNTNEFLNLAKQITDRRPSLNKEKNRRTKLMLALLANVGSGCMGETPVTNLEVIIDGVKVPDLDVTILKQTDQYVPIATAGETDFDFYLGSLSGTGFTFTNNELQNKLFGVSIHYSIPVPKDKTFKLSSIDEISIRKKVPAYSIKDYCNIGGKPIAKCGQQRDVHEVERYQINSITIKANGKVFYSLNEIQHIFSVNKGTETNKSLGLSWQDTNVQFNDAYLNLLQQKDCPSASGT